MNKHQLGEIIWTRYNTTSTLSCKSALYNLQIIIKLNCEEHSTVKLPHCPRSSRVSSIYQTPTKVCSDNWQDT